MPTSTYTSVVIVNDNPNKIPLGSHFFIYLIMNIKIFPFRIKENKYFQGFICDINIINGMEENRVNTHSFLQKGIHYHFTEKKILVHKVSCSLQKQDISTFSSLSITMTTMKLQTRICEDIVSLIYFSCGRPAGNTLAFFPIIYVTLGVYVAIY